MKNKITVEKITESQKPVIMTMKELLHLIDTTSFKSDNSNYITCDSLIRWNRAEGHITEKEEALLLYFLRYFKKHPNSADR